MSDFSTSVLRLGLKAFGGSGLARACQPIFGGMGAILMFHHVGYRAPSYFGANDHLSVRPEFLHALLDEFRQECVDIVSVQEAVWRMRSAKTTNPFVALTFDDGYRDNIESAYPILQNFRVPFTLFVCSGFVDRKVPIWWLSLEKIIQGRETLTMTVDGEKMTFVCASKMDKKRTFDRVTDYLHRLDDRQLHTTMDAFYREYDHDPLRLVDEEMSTWEMLRELNKDPLVTIGAHTVSHPFLSTLCEEGVKREIEESRDRIAEMTGSTPTMFAYPYGYENAVDKREVGFVEDLGFEAAFTTRKGVVQPHFEGSMMAIPRMSVNGHYQSLSAMRALMSGFPFYLANRWARSGAL